MEPVSNIDRIVVLLRQRLAEQARRARADKGPKAGSRDAAEKSAFQVLAGVGSLDDHRLKRTLVQSILADQFGSASLNDARFQGLVDKVTDGLDAEPETAGLLAEVIAEVRRRPI